MNINIEEMLKIVLSRGESRVVCVAFSFFVDRLRILVYVSDSLILRRRKL